MLLQTCGYQVLSCLVVWTSPVELFETENLRKTPLTRSTEAAVTMLIYRATEKMESSLIIRLWSSAMLITMSWEPVSVVALCEMASPTRARVTCLGRQSLSTTCAALSRVKLTVRVGAGRGDCCFQHASVVL